ncbi:glycoside hydrolase family 28 protein [Aulographum hederae CBS 113979]|uniref:endo-polygalacturonase n=1 Tax=Aulographum hederae CBS 113979 TaxID=1176131 RepID=A0A6G1GKH8_9PEZI|nr:glycoside hydrolase family 28 protein [Aulographum hederae CBS 113979]
MRSSLFILPTLSALELAAGYSIQPRDTESSDSNAFTGNVFSSAADPGCTFTSAAGLAKAGACKSIVLSSIAVPAGQNLSLEKLQPGTQVTFESHTTFGHKNWAGPLISISGKGVTVTGAPGHLIDGGGPAYWDGVGGNGGSAKPKFFYAHGLDDSTITGLSPTTSASNTSPSTTLPVTRNQDDCLAINSGTNITFSNGLCSGGHGMSIGSVGGRSSNVVENIHIHDSTVERSQNGIRIKTIAGATGSVSNVVYENIMLNGITKYGIDVQQDYRNGGATGKPSGGVPVTGLAIRGVKGTVASSGQRFYILCAACKGWSFEGIALTGGKAKGKGCMGIPTGLGADVTC